MAIHSLKYRKSCNQAIFNTREGESMQERLFYNFVDDLIIEFGKPQDNTFYLYASDLPKYIQKLFLTYLIDPSELEDLLDYVRPETLIDEHLTDMQKAIDSRVDDVYREVKWAITSEMI